MITDISQPGEAGVGSTQYGNEYLYLYTAGMDTICVLGSVCEHGD